MIKRIVSLLLILGLPSVALAAIPLIGSGTYTPDQIQAATNSVINSVNVQSLTCTTTGCSAGGTSAAPAVTGTCATAGGGAGFVVGSGANAYAGSITCASSANTSAIITWAVARAAVPVCTFSGTTGAVVTATSTAGILTLNYASVSSNVISYICVGQ